MWRMAWIMSEVETIAYIPPLRLVDNMIMQKNSEYIPWSVACHCMKSSLSRSCYYHIRQLRCIRPRLQNTQHVATSFIHSKLDYFVL